MRNKFHDLVAIATLENFDIIGVTESWINTEKRDFLAEYSIKGYSLFSCERSERAGGGVLLYVKPHLHPQEITKPQISNIDIKYVQILSGSEKLILALVYRPPAQNSNVDNELCEQILDICNHNDAIIFGDFNLPVTVWGGTLNSHSGHEIYSNILESSLYQHIYEPTRGESILDIVLSTNDNLINNVAIGPEFSTSDHRSVLFTIECNIGLHNNSYERVPDFQRADFNKLRRILENTDWSEIYGIQDVEQAWNLFIDILRNAIAECVPMRDRRPANNAKPKWWNIDIRNILLAKKRAYRRYKSTQSQADKLEYTRIRRETKRLIKISKKLQELHIASNCKENPKEFFRYINEKKVLKSTIGPLLSAEGEIVTDEREIADVLNDYFASVFTVEENRRVEAIPHQMNVAAQLLLIDITEEDVMRVIDKLKICKSPGPDKIYPRILKEVKEAICKPLCVIFNLSLRTGKVVREWKLANVTPLFKKGDKSNPGNYRPISLTSVVCKLMESILRDKIVKFLEENNIIRDSQHGFRNKRSCLTNLLDFLYDIYEMYEEGRAVDIIYLDFQKAFDKVPHKKLLNKLEYHGIRGHIHCWISDWLSNRKQRVVLNGKFSDWRNVSSGVPQGSVLGPILFLIYINDLDENVKCKISKFADDTKIANRVISLSQQQELQNDLNTLGEWAVDSQMFFNVDKCKVLHIGNRNVQANYTMNGIQLAKVEQEKDLGVVISNDLKPSKQCSEVVKTANKLIGFIGRSFEFRTEEIILSLYNALVRPHLEFCVQCWSPYYKKDMDKLERVQRRVTKLIPRLRNKPYEERLSELNLFSLSKRRLRGDLIEVFKIIKGIENMDMGKYFTIDTSNTTRNNGYKIVGKRFQTNEAKYFFFNRVVNIWNSLPFNVVDCSTTEIFKKRLDIYLAANPRLELFTPV